MITATTQTMNNHEEVLRVTQSITRRYPLVYGKPLRGFPNKGYHYRYSVGGGYDE